MKGGLLHRVGALLQRLLSLAASLVILTAIVTLGLYAAGIKPYVVVTGSMEPAIPVRSICFVNENVPLETIKVGEVISFRLSDNMLVTHRVVAVTDGAYTTKGDANNIADAAPVTAENYIGKTVFVIPKLGVLLVLLHTAGGKIAAAALALVLLGGLCGGAVTGLMLRDQNSAQTSAVQSEAEAPALQSETVAPTAADRALPQQDAAMAAEESETQTAEPAVQEVAQEAAQPTAAARTALYLIDGDETEDKTPAEIYADCVNSVVAITNNATTTNVFGQTSPTASSGSGFIVSADGYIITNYHVVEGADTLEVTLTNGDSYTAELIGYDSDNADIALIKIDATGLTPVSLGNSDALAVGEQVVAIGNPLGELTNTLTVGYISALDRVIAMDTDKDLNVMQTDCAINPGNSGGPLFDMHGNVIGITTAKYSSSTVEGIGFVIPINDVTAIIGDLVQYGYVTGRPWLGVTVRNLSEDVIAYYGLSGIYVNDVVTSGPAAEAGLQAGDIITALNGEKLSTTTELTTALKNCTAGDVVTLSVLRNGEALTLTVTLGDKHDGDELIAAQQAALAQQQQEQQSQSGVYSYGLPGGLEDWFNYFYGGGR